MAFLRDFPTLYANRRTRGKYVCYQNDNLVAITKDYLSMIREVNKKNVPEPEYLILRVEEGVNREQQLFAQEGEIELE